MAHIPKQPIDPALQAEENAKKIAELEAQVQALITKTQGVYIRSSSISTSVTKGFKIKPGNADDDFVFVIYNGTNPVFGYFYAKITAQDITHTPLQNEGIDPFYDNGEINFPLGAYGRVIVIGLNDFTLTRY